MFIKIILKTIFWKLFSKTFSNTTFISLSFVFHPHFVKISQSNSQSLSPHYSILILYYTLKIEIATYGLEFFINFIILKFKSFEVNFSRNWKRQINELLKFVFKFVSVKYNTWKKPRIFGIFKLLIFCITCIPFSNS